jgi:hypothetical protein
VPSRAAVKISGGIQVRLVSHKDDTHEGSPSSSAVDVLVCATGYLPADPSSVLGALTGLFRTDERVPR